MSKTRDLTVGKDRIPQLHYFINPLNTSNLNRKTNLIEKSYAGVTPSPSVNSGT